MNIEVTDACNLHCSSCRTPHGDNYMTLDTFNAILTRIKQHTSLNQVRLYWRGEPCLHRHLPELAEAAKSHGVKKVMVSTNTCVPFLTSREYVSKLLNSVDRLILSVDGYDQESLLRYRVGADHGCMIRSLATIASVKTDCSKEMRVLMFKYNDGHEEYYRELARNTNVDYLHFAAPIINYRMRMKQGEADEWLSANPKYQRYKKRGDEWFLKRDGCSPHLCISIHGTVHPCGHDWHLNHSLGNILEDSWIDIRGRFNTIKPKMMAREFSMCEKYCCLPSGRVNYREDV